MRVHGPACGLTSPEALLPCRRAQSQDGPARDGPWPGGPAHAAASPAAASLLGAGLPGRGGAPRPAAHRPAARAGGTEAEGIAGIVRHLEEAGLLDPGLPEEAKRRSARAFQRTGELPEPAPPGGRPTERGAAGPAPGAAGSGRPREREAGAGRRAGASRPPSRFLLAKKLSDRCAVGEPGTPREQRMGIAV